MTRGRWLFWAWVFLAPFTVVEMAFSLHMLRACRAAASSAHLPECGPGLTLRPGESCSVTIPAMPSILLPTPSRAPHGLFAPKVVPS